LKRSHGFVIFIAIIILFSGFNVKAGFNNNPGFDGTEVEEFLDTIIQGQMRENNIPNLTVSVVSGEEIIFKKGYGYADIDAQTPVDPGKTLFRIGSSSKIFTWTAIMQLFERGYLDLDTDINEYLDFIIPDGVKFGGRTSGNEPITIKHLMTHTPGFEAYSTNMFFLSQEKLEPLDEFVRERMPARVFPPGKISAYSNYGSSLAGYIVERVSGIPFARYIEENIYEPLDMGSSSFRQPLPHQLSPNMTNAYRFIDGEFKKGKFEFMSEPAGSMSTTASDMGRFMLALLQGGQIGGQRVLGQETVDKMFSQLLTHHPLLDGMAYGFIEETFNGRRVLFHPGGTMLFDTGFYLLPEEGVGFFISHSGGNPLVNDEVFYAFMNNFFPGEETAGQLSHGGTHQNHQDIPGEYYLNRRSFTTSDKFLSIAMDFIYVGFDEEGYLFTDDLGRVDRFTEIEPGVFRNLDNTGGFRTIVFGTDPLWKTLLMTDGPISYSRANWYETRGINFLTIIFSVLLVILSNVYWGIKSLVQKGRGKKGKKPVAFSKGEKVARYFAVGYGVLTVIFLVDFISANIIDPIYVLPKEAYGEFSPLAPVFNLVPWAMGGLGLIILPTAFFAWFKSFWGILGRIHYSFFALATMGLLWVFIFWNAISF